MSVAITGASGFVGRHLVKCFRESGWRVVALVRNPASFADTEVEVRQYDLSNAQDKKMLTDVDVLIHAAYIKSHEHGDAYKMNVEGAKGLHKLAADVKKSVFISSMSSQKNAPSLYGKQKFEIEKIFSGSSDLIIRPGFIIGNGGIYKSILNLIKTYHVVPLIGRGSQPMQIISIFDLVEGIEAAILKDLSGLITLANPTPITFKTLFSQTCKINRLRAFFIPLPYPLLLALIKIASILLPTLEVGPDNLKGLRSLRNYDTKQDMEAVGLLVPQPKEYLSSISAQIPK